MSNLYHSDEESKYTKYPKRHSLNTSFIDVPNFYINTGEKILKFDYFNMIYIILEIIKN